MKDHPADPIVENDQPNLLDVLGELMDLPTGERNARMDAMGLSAEHRCQLEKWLAASPDSSTALRATPRDVLNLLGESGSREPAEKARVAAPPAQAVHVSEGPGSRVGRFTILEEIGRGATGVVFLAEQAPPAQPPRVALKILDPPHDAKRVLARFELRRPSLAKIDHPGIARVLGCGMTESGRPFFVSEWVNGPSIIEFCDQNSLKLQDRLKLFGDVCEAVQHAHAMGVFHGGIKPANVLVQMTDRFPSPRITDLGTSHASGAAAAERRLFIETGRWPAGIGYISPAQLSPKRPALKARDDIYSLGVLLYELLAGIAPLDERQLRSEMYEELCRIILFASPAPPGVRLESAARTLRVVGTSDARHAAELADLMRGRLDRIVMRCLHRKPTARYPSARKLSEDVERYLEGRPLTLIERLCRFTQALMPSFF
jgi:serine/threonine protein kinase